MPARGSFVQEADAEEDSQGRQAAPEDQGSVAGRGMAEPDILEQKEESDPAKAEQRGVHAAERAVPGRSGRWDQEGGGEGEAQEGHGYRG